MNSHRNTSGTNEEHHHENGNGSITRTTYTRTMSTIESAVDSSASTVTHNQVTVYEERVEELYTLIEKKAELEASSGGDRKNEEYLRIQRRIAELKDTVNEMVSEFGHDEFRTVYSRLDDRQAPA